MGLLRTIEKRVRTEWAWDTHDTSEFFNGGHDTYTGKRITKRLALSMSAVFACVNIIGNGVSALPVATYREVGEQRRREANPRWLDKPNSFMGPFQFWSRVLNSLLLDGNAFIWTQRNEQGHVIGLVPLDPARCEVEDDGQGGVRFTVDGQAFGREWILWIPAFVLAGELRGISPLEVQRQAIGLGLTAEEFGARFFAQGTTMAGVIEHPKNPKPDEAELLRTMFRKSHSGIKKSHAVGVLTGGASWKSITITPEQAQFLDTRRFQKADIALFYQVPPYRVDPSITSTWGSGIEEQNKMFIDETLMPWVIRIEEAVSLFLLPGKQFIKFNLNARLRANTKDRYDAYRVAVDTGFMSIDEARALEDLPPLPNGEGQAYYRPANSFEIGKAPPVKPDRNPRDGDES